MPNKALVAFGVVLACGLLAATGPAWCSEANAAGPSAGQVAATPPAADNERPAPAGGILPPLTLEEAQARALRSSPELAAFAREVEARVHETHQAGAYPNPELSLEVENVAGSGAFSGSDSAETTLRLSQRVELGGKRAQRRSAGRLDEEAARAAAALARGEVLAATRERFVAALAARQRLALAEEQAELAGRVRQAVDERIAAGKAAAIEGLQPRTLAAEARLRRDNARRVFEGARRALAAAWGSETPDFRLAGDLFERLPAVPDREALFARLAESPRLAAGRSAQRQAEGAVALARSAAVPDLTVSLGVKDDRESGDHALLAELAVPLPLFDRNRGGVGAARARLAAAQEEARSARLQAQVALDEAWQHLQAARGEAELLGGEVVPAAEKRFEAVAYGYRAGKFGILDLLDAERALSEARSRRIDALTDCHRAVSEIERLLGQGLLPADTLSDSSDDERGRP